ncbi:MAG TPA: hypothetical protein VF331_19340 [Polyangiales bacterium]
MRRVTHSGTVGAAVLMVMVSACGSADAAADLPAGWSGAERITQFTQMECGGHPGIPGAPPEAIQAVGTVNGLDVDYEHANFRCDQQVEGFARRTGPALDMLVQPIDMHPVNVAGCDCSYHIKASIRVEVGTFKVSVYRRWDALTIPNEPLKIGQADVDVPSKK